MTPRKYDQRGYLEDAEEPRGKGRKAPRERREGPRGRGLGAPTESVFRCSQCGRKQQDWGTLGNDSSCHGCGADLHTCTHCRHFDTSAPLECRQQIPERIKSKTKRNDCALFEPKITKEFAGERESPKDARAAFDDLFDL